MKKIINVYYLFDKEDKKKVMDQLWDKGMSVTDLANKIGVSLGYVSSVLNGKSNVTPRVVQQFNDAGIKIEVGE